MNRRDLLKRTGALALGLPALRASGMTNPAFQPGTSTLIVNVSGPFSFVQQQQWLIAAPQVGPNFKSAEHAPWVGTYENEISLGTSGEAYALNIPGVSGTADTVGLNMMNSTPPSGSSPVDPLFTITVPFANVTIGVRPTFVAFIPANASKPSPPPMKSSANAVDAPLIASGLTFVYNNVDLTSVNLTGPGNFSYQPCFHLDALLPGSAATLNIHLSQLVRNDQGHGKAKLVWGQTMKLLPWMKKDFSNIDFLSFSLSKCPPAPNSPNPPAGPSSGMYRGRPGLPQTGPGNDCEVPIVGVQGGNNAQKK